MKMFPNMFSPSPGTQARGERFKIDVESAVELMLTACADHSDGLSQQFRLKILKTLPPKAIDWDTVNWVQLGSFKTIRA